MRVLIDPDQAREVLLTNGMDVVRPKQLQAAMALADAAVKVECRRIAMEFFQALHSDLEKGVVEETEGASEAFSRTYPHPAQFVLWMGKRTEADEPVKEAKQ